MSQDSFDPPAKSPAECRDMADLRQEIDRLDRAIVALLAARAGYVARAAELKPRRGDIVDEPRIAAVIDRVRAEAQRQGADADLVEAIYRSMIRAFIAFENEAFDRRQR